MAAAAAPLTLCLVMGEHLTNHYAGPIARGAAAAAVSLGHRLIIYSPPDININQQQLALELLPLLPQHADGYLLPSYAADDLVALAARRGARLLVYAGRRGALPAIGPDNFASAQRAVAHLVGHGRRRIAHLSGLPDNVESHERQRGYRAALAAAGLPYDPALVASGMFRLSEGRAAVAAMLAHGVSFDAIFAANDRSAVGALHALHDAGLRVPDDVALVGFDDSVGSEMLDPPLTTIRQSAFEIGWQAVVALAHQPSDTPLADVAVPTTLVLRRSCGCRDDLGSLEDWTDRLATQLGSRQGPTVHPDEVRDWLGAFDAALHLPQEWARRVDRAIASAHERGWYTPALRDYIPLWAARHLANDAPAATLDAFITTALDRLSLAREARHSRQRTEREERLNRLAYVIDLLRAHPPDQGQEIALRYVVESGLSSAIVCTADRPGGDGCTATQIRNGQPNTQWHGPIGTFPPAPWLAPGETLLLMPLTSDHTPATIGIIEGESAEHIDLDDLLLRSINTYRTVARFNETLRDLETARAVQQNLLPRSAPRHPNWRIAGAARTARQVGGDLYSFHQRPSGGLALAVGDVAGKGMPAALLMASCVTTLAGLMEADLTPAETLRRMHQILQPYVGHGQHTAICLAYLDGPELRCANAGAVAPIVRTGGAVQLLEVSGLPLGTPLSALLPYGESHHTLAPGDLLVLCSDGIVEAMNTQGDLFGFERLLAAIACGPADPDGMLNHLFATVAAFTREREPHDDMALVVALLSP